MTLNGALLTDRDKVPEIAQQSNVACMRMCELILLFNLCKMNKPMVTNGRLRGQLYLKCLTFISLRQCH